MRIRVACIMLALCLSACGAASPDEPTLAGSRESMIRQNRIAQDEGLELAPTMAEVGRLAEAGQLVPVPGNADYRVLPNVVPFAVPAVRAFVEHTAEVYREICPDTLVVTSLVRPVTAQPPNAHPLSVHPIGMSVDLRIPADPQCKDLLTGYLLVLEHLGVLDVTEERAPPHLHVAVYPSAFMAYMEWTGFEPEGAPAYVQVVRPETDGQERRRPSFPFALLLVVLGALTIVLVRRTWAG